MAAFLVDDELTTGGKASPDCSVATAAPGHTGCGLVVVPRLNSLVDVHVERSAEQSESADSDRQAVESVGETVHDLVVVHANGRVLVMARGRAGDLKQTLDTLPDAVRNLP